MTVLLVIYVGLGLMAWRHVKAEKRGSWWVIPFVDLEPHGNLYIIIGLGFGLVIFVLAHLR
jgi:hypothetical protein